jgi:hypothetical protein
MKRTAEGTNPYCCQRRLSSHEGIRPIGSRINLYRTWLDQYELEVYLLMKLLCLSYKCHEVL